MPTLIWTSPPSKLPSPPCFPTGSDLQTVSKFQVLQALRELPQATGCAVFRGHLAEPLPFPHF